MPLLLFAAAVSLAVTIEMLPAWIWWLAPLLILWVASVLWHEHRRAVRRRR